jgi:hypothetical protein
VRFFKVRLRTVMAYILLAAWHEGVMPFSLSGLVESALADEEQQ